VKDVKDVVRNVGEQFGVMADTTKRANETFGGLADRLTNLQDAPPELLEALHELGPALVANARWLLPHLAKLHDAVARIASRVEECSASSPAPFVRGDSTLN
jgi:hypothetical protein